MRKFLIWYPALRRYAVQDVTVDPGESVEDAIIREGDAMSAWEYVGEVV